MDLIGWADAWYANENGLFSPLSWVERIGDIDVLMVDLTKSPHFDPVELEPGQAVPGHKCDRFFCSFRLDGSESWKLFLYVNKMASAAWHNDGSSARRTQVPCNPVLIYAITGRPPLIVHCGLTHATHSSLFSHFWVIYWFILLLGDPFLHNNTYMFNINAYELMSSILLSVVSATINTLVICLAEQPVRFKVNHPDLSAKLEGAWSQMTKDAQSDMS